jgi:NAD(P)-dependent dehydrogenase (short-subunit alcohol dehydrogenase family)
VTARRRPRARPDRRPPSPPLHGRVALVTGAGRGIGRATAAALAEAGAAVVLAARTQREIEAVARRITARGGRTLAVACDVRRAAQVEALVAQAVGRFRRLDVLVNNAGLFRIAPLADTDEALWDAILDTNLKGAYLVTRAALPHLVARRGHVVNMISIAGRVALPGNVAYGASKAGLLGFTNVLREELRPLGVRVTALLPGATDTAAWDGVRGTWDRTRMLRPEVVARLVVEIVTRPGGAGTDEVVLSPVGGAQ